jgi:nicotinate-nucleotide pyrophosphorylase (carboxylating)
MELSLLSLIPQINVWLEEDDLNRNFYYTRSLPVHPVKLYLNIKSPLVLAGTDFFAATFAALGVDPQAFHFFKDWEGRKFAAGEVIEIPTPVPFAVAVTGERLALNLLQHGSSIATYTAAHVELAKNSQIKILDTRKTTPGLRNLEKHAVRVGGGFNHRLGQTDVWMIKDNHKSSLGGLKGALAFFQKQGAFYNNIIAEIHTIDELKEAIELKINHVMLDNFSPDLIKEAIKFKKLGMTFEVSGGLKLSTLTDYLIPGVDALSIGALTHSAPRVDLSLKYRSL